MVYVWFDALGNYITALGYAEDGSLFRRYWLENPYRVHVIGKGITRFHAVYWPAMLLSAGLPLPSSLFIHGYITLNGEKVSKSLGNTVDPVELAGQYGADALRYYLLREIKASEDGDFTLERFIRSYNAGLADQLGNLLSRVIGMINRYYDGVVPVPAAEDEAGRALIEAAGTLPERVEAAMSGFAPHEALALIWDFIGAANKYVVEVQPWQLARRRPDDPAAEARLATALYNLVETLRLAAYYCQPFLPATAEKIAGQLGIGLDLDRPWDELTQWGQLPAGTVVQPGEVLFPRLDV